MPSPHLIRGRIEFDLIGISGSDLDRLYEELVEVVEHHHQDLGMEIKHWKSYMIELNDDA